ncbi:Nucleoside-diphosphate-sugar epimerase [Ekhidna lutea]|uniref:Nucleoside-diphosphate-sugar epimerase n=1 Tax=Ekhidna lutea TaxID=447679 RepID=A0A239FTM2_EKHLU|nr:NAD(P)-dependent oxidoreductase [Ekhidna lutea]SNS60150.1 Nucleoside-diphosphate-sugar epimerase [Ekhidna lutea]
MKIAITGANGFLGSYLVKECLHRQMEVYALIRSGANTSLLPDHENLNIETIDYRGDIATQLSKIKERSGHVDYFIHNAGMTVSLKAEEYYSVNVGLTTAICDALRQSELLKPVGVFVYTSSYAAHGPANTKAPVSHYGHSKLQAEQIIQERMKNYLLVRPTAIYGAGDEAFLPLFKGAKMGIYPVTDNDQRMSMIHGADLARMTIQDMQSERGPLHYNDGNTYLHQDFIEIFQKLFGKKVRKIPLPKWLAKLSMGSSDIWHKIINKRPGITLEKFDEISQHWDLHTTDLKHSSVKPEISLSEGFENALRYYQENNLI